MTTASPASPDSPDSPDSPGDDGYTGPATLVHGEVTVPVEVTLRGLLDTISGDYHWYGRIAVDPAVTTLAGDVGSTAVVLRTPEGEAATRLADVDPWGRYRVEGRGHAPFTVLTDVPASD